MEGVAWEMQSETSDRESWRLGLGKRQRTLYSRCYDGDDNDAANGKIKVLMSRSLVFFVISVSFQILINLTDAVLIMTFSLYIHHY